MEALANLSTEDSVKPELLRGIASFATGGAAHSAVYLYHMARTLAALSLSGMSPIMCVRLHYHHSIKYHPEGVCRERLREADMVVLLLGLLTPANASLLLPVLCTVDAVCTDGMQQRLFAYDVADTFTRLHSESARDGDAKGRPDTVAKSAECEECQTPVPYSVSAAQSYPQQ